MWTPHTRAPKIGDKVRLKDITISPLQYNGIRITQAEIDLLRGRICTVSKTLKTPWGFVVALVETDDLIGIDAFEFVEELETPQTNYEESKRMENNKPLVRMEIRLVTEDERKMSPDIKKYVYDINIEAYGEVCMYRRSYNSLLRTIEKAQELITNFFMGEDEE